MPPALSSGRRDEAWFRPCSVGAGAAAAAAAATATARAGHRLLGAAHRGEGREQRPGSGAFALRADLDLVTDGVGAEDLEAMFATGAGELVDGHVIIL